MEIKTVKELLDEYRETSLFSFEHFPEHIIEKIAHEYASQAVRLALEEAAEKAKIHYSSLDRDEWVDKASILSLADSIIGKLK